MPLGAHAKLVTSDGGSDPVELLESQSYCAWTLARAHARSGDRVAIASYLGGKDLFDQAIADFPPPTPTRTNATLLALKKQQLTARSRWNEDFKGRLLLSHDNRLSLHGIGAAV